MHTNCCNHSQELNRGAMLDGEWLKSNKFKKLNFFDHKIIIFVINCRPTVQQRNCIKIKQHLKNIFSESKEN